MSQHRGTSGGGPERGDLPGTPRDGSMRSELVPLRMPEMMEPRRRTPLQPAPRIDHEGATSLLRLGMVGPRRGVDAVIDRLRMPDGAQWLESSLLVFAPSAEEARAMLVEGSARLDQLGEAKERHKQAMLSSAPASERQRAILLYYLCIAAGLAHHARSLTSQPQADVSAALLDLAVALPEPWSLMLARAADPG